jgi:hypothetical protein
MEQDLLKPMSVNILRHFIGLSRFGHVIKLFLHEPYLTSMRAQKIKVAARLRPRLGAEIDDGSVRVEHVHDISTGSTVTGTSCISVANPRDPAQIFKFPSVVSPHHFRFFSIILCFAQIHVVLRQGLDTGFHIRP